MDESSWVEAVITFGAFFALGAELIPNRRGEIWARFFGLALLFFGAGAAFVRAVQEPSGSLFLPVAFTVLALIVGAVAAFNLAKGEPERRAKQEREAWDANWKRMADKGLVPPDPGYWKHRKPLADTEPRLFPTGHDDVWIVPGGQWLTGYTAGAMFHVIQFPEIITAIQDHDPELAEKMQAEVDAWEKRQGG